MLSTIVTWRNRPQIGQSIESLLELCRRVDGELVLVDMGSSSPLYNYIAELPPLARVVRIEADEFCKPVAQNVGAKRARGTMFFFCDCDIIVDVDAVLDLVHAVNSDKHAFGTIAEVTESAPLMLARGQILTFGYSLSITLVNGRSLVIADGEADPLRPTRKAPGLLMVHRAQFLEVNGFDSNLRGWGWEDQDMIARLTLGAGFHRISRGKATHISHDDALRVAEYRDKDLWTSRDRSFRQALANYDRGSFLGTFAVDTEKLEEMTP